MVKHTGENYYISTAIAYASGKPHIGNTYEIVLADSIARFRRMQAISMLHIVRSIQLRRDAHIQLLMELKAEAALQV